MARSTWISLLLVSAVQSAIVSQFSNPSRLTGTNFGIPDVPATYDYVIVGGGLAGSVVASRLTQHSNATVAVIEAGSFYEINNGNWTQVPYWSEQWAGDEEDDWQPVIDWGLFTEPQNGERMHYAQGKSLGGSSGRNQMMFQRPTKGSYQAWADHVGDQSYTWDAMLPYLQRSVQFSPNEAKRSGDPKPLYNVSDYSPTGGPLQVTYPAYTYPLSTYGSQAFSSIGMKELPSFANGQLNGFSIDPNTGLRSSAQTSFLDAAIGRPRLTLYINSMARNIIFNGTTATGVNVTNNGVKPFTISARKEVIVSAGAYHSPQLLMVSGVGPKATLEKFGISVVSDREDVGQNMWDSCALGSPTYEINATGYSTWQQHDRMDEAQNELLYNASGPLTNMGLDMGAWEKLPAAYRANLSSQAREALAKFPADWPELEFSLDSEAKELTPSDTSKQYGTLGVLLVAATSRGNMTIQSASNLDPPIISPNWLQDSTDQEVAVQAYKRAREAWKAIPIRVGEEYFPGTNVTTDEQLLETIKKNFGPIHHASSSCAMGKVDDPVTVVDSQARVLGTEQLRVIDSSSFPFTPPGHTQGVMYAHAEKLVQVILDGLDLD